MAFDTKDAQLKAAEARSIARQGALHLSSLIRPGGRFVYAYDAGSGAKAKGYNALRHAGATWTLFHVAGSSAVDSGVEGTAAQALEYLEERYIRPFGGGPALCVTAKDNVKLGGAALAVLALLAAPPGPCESHRRDIARRLGDYLLSQENQVDFVHKRSYSTGNASDFRSDYYSGEALFALARLHDHAIEGAWLDRGLALLQVLGRRDYGVREQSHWMLYALDAFHRHRAEPWLAHYASRIAADIVVRPEYRSWDRSTPIACRSEGLLAYLRLASRCPMELLPLSPLSVWRTLEENLALQAAFRTELGGFVRGAGSKQVRIDYIQHNVSAFNDYALLVTQQAPVSA